MGKTALALAPAAAAFTRLALSLSEGQTFTYTAIGTIAISGGLLGIEGGALILAASDSLDLGVLTLLSSGSITASAVPSLLILNDQTTGGGGLFPLIGGLPSGPASLLTVNQHRVGYLNGGTSGDPRA
jgi:hypothetical protein